MSSSSALLISVFFAIARSNRLSSRADYRRAITAREQLAAYLGAIENGRPFGRLRGDVGVGTLGGNQDQIAITCAEAGRLVRYGWSPVRHEATLAMPAGHTFALATSGITAPKTGTAMARYNHAATAVQRLTAEWNARTGRDDPMLFDALTSGPDAASGLRDIAGALADAQCTAAFLVSRLEQFAEESLEIIPAACDALSRGALAEFGLLVDRSQQLAEDKLENQIPETVALQRHARALGATAASAFGAGFGGSVWALVPQRGAKSFLAKWKAAYTTAHPQHAAAAEFFLSIAGPPAYQF
jgi:galactokinase